MAEYNINAELAAAGKDKIDWVRSYTPLLNRIKEEFSVSQPFKGMRIVTSVHLEAKTAYLAYVLRAGGGDLYVTGSNPLSTQDDVAEALRADGFNVFCRHGVSMDEYYDHQRQALACHPHLIIDDGGDLTQLLHSDCRDLADCIIGGCEETTTGILRIRGRENDGTLNYPMMAVNDGDCKHLFDNRYGTGQSTMTAMMAVTNLSVSSRVVVVAGYGWCGKGVAMRAKGMGARVIVTEVDPVKAIEAAMDGFQVLPMEEAAPLGDMFITLTGCKGVLRKEHFQKMKDGALLANSGHFDVEICLPELRELAVKEWRRKPDITGYQLADGRIINLLAEGRLVNLAAGMGHPAEIMDMSFALQAKCLEYVAKHGAELDNKLYPVPREIDQEVARMKLEALGLAIDRLTPEQERYLAGYMD